MNLDKIVANEVAHELLKIGAVKLSPSKPFTWASGKLSPIYCDNRIVLSYPLSRTIVRDAFCKIIQKAKIEFDLIAGVATGAIAHGVLVADVLNKPFVYVRDKPKGHGRQNVIEGEFHAGQKVLVIEDGISTGGSSLKAVEALREAGCEVICLISIFSYEFQVAKDAFEQAKCTYYSLSNFPSLIEMYKENQLYTPEDIQFMENWYKS
ncbi:MAG: orotate phosphoribosyltransferase [Bacteroidetes bacterium]|nr:orotate phosphoribosyltransferase [Bacteroidota bacterium]